MKIKIKKYFKIRKLKKEKERLSNEMCSLANFAFGGFMKEANMQGDIIIKRIKEINIEISKLTNLK